MKRKSLGTPEVESSVRVKPWFAALRCDSASTAFRKTDAADGEGAISSEHAWKREKVLRFCYAVLNPSDDRGLHRNGSNVLITEDNHPMDFIVRIVVRINPTTTSTETYEHGPFVTRRAAVSFATAFVSSHSDVAIVAILEKGRDLTVS